MTQYQRSSQDAFLSAADLKALVERQQQARAAAEKKHTEEAQAAKKALLKQLEKPVQITEQQVANALSRFRNAAAAGQSELVVFSFPSQLCTDRGRMINNALEGWRRPWSERLARFTKLGNATSRTKVIVLGRGCWTMSMACRARSALSSLGEGKTPNGRETVGRNIATQPLTQ